MNAAVWSVVVYILSVVDPCAPAGVLDCAPGRFYVVRSVVVYLLTAVDPCAPAGVLDCAPGRFSVRRGDCAIVCVVLACAAGRALTLLCAAVW